MYLKYSALEYDYEWIIILEPNGIPLKPLDEIFHLYNRTVTKEGTASPRLLGSSQYRDFFKGHY